MLTGSELSARAKTPRARLLRNGTAGERVSYDTLQSAALSTFCLGLARNMW